MFHVIGSRRVHSLSFGSGPRTLVAVAGSFANWEIWAPVFERLSPSWRVVSFDHDGVGQTKVPVDEISHERHVETLLSVLDAQEVDRCVVAGDSANAAVTIAAVVASPERFDGLVVANGHAWGFDRPEVRQFVDGLRTNFEGTVDFFVDLVFPEPDSDHLKHWLRDIIHRTGPEPAARILEANYDVDLRPRLAEIRVPTLIIHVPSARSQTCSLTTTRSPTTPGRSCCPSRRPTPHGSTPRSAWRWEPPGSTATKERPRSRQTPCVASSPKVRQHTTVDVRDGPWTSNRAAVGGSRATSDIRRARRPQIRQGDRMSRPSLDDGHTGLSVTQGVQGWCSTLS